VGVVDTEELLTTTTAEEVPAVAEEELPGVMDAEEDAEALDVPKLLLELTEVLELLLAMAPLEETTLSLEGIVAPTEDEELSPPLLISILLLQAKTSKLAKNTPQHFFITIS